MVGSELDKPAIVFRKGATAPLGEPRTLIVLGAARGGTTMIAQILHNLGVFMGEALDSTYQDAALGRISRALFHRQIDVADPCIAQLMRSRDRQFNVWGWKFPTHVFDGLYALARNPHVVVVLRDAVAIATRESVSYGYGVAACFRRARDQLARLGDFVDATSHPCLILSYERAQTRKLETVDALVEFAGITAVPAVRQRAAQRAAPGSARYLDETRAATVDGTIDRVDSTVYGWLRYPHQINRRVAFTLLIDDIEMHAGVADLFREDLLHAFDNDGRCSFSVPLPPNILDGRDHKISIIVPGERSCSIANNDRNWTIPQC